MIDSPYFYMFPVGNELMKYDKLAINVVVATKDGGIDNCDIPFTDDLEQFHLAYSRLTKQVTETCETYQCGEEYAIIGTSALVDYEIDGAVTLYSGIYNNPFLIWGSYRKRLLKTTISFSFQFHHTQMDGATAAKFLTCLQEEMKQLSF